MVPARSFTSDGERWTTHRNVNELKMVESQARRTMMARADATPQLRGADKSDWFGLRREMLLRMAAPTLQASHFELISRKGTS
jgi:hypothetical protein